METWKDVPRYEGRYQVSDLGRVRSLLNYGGQDERVLKICTTQRGYRYVTLRTGNDEERRGKQHLVHRLVLEAFVGPCPKGMRARHLDGNLANNELSNLRWDTVRNAIQEDLRRNGKRGRLTKLDAAAVRAIKERVKAGDQQSKLAKEFGVASSTISAIVHGTSWGWV